MNNNKRVNIAYIGGGSVNFGWKLFSDLANEEICATINLYDIDKQLSLANEVIGNKFRENNNCRSDIIYLAVDTPEEALHNADIVILAFNQGTIEEMVSELSLPETYGIYQSTGEHTGPSGVIKALKTLPVYIKYTELIKKQCPDAWVMNISNPMAVCMKIMYEVFPEVKLFGSTNELFPTLDLLCGIAEREYGVENIRRREFKYNLKGIAGFCWYDELNLNGEDFFPIFRKYAEKYYETGFELKANEYKTSPMASANKIKFDLFLRYGLIPAVSDRMAADFCPPWYLNSPKTIQSWKFSQTTVNYIKKVRLDRMSRIKSLMSGEESLRIGSGLSDCALQIKALLGHGNLITNVCLKNQGQVGNLPIDAIVETNALISKNSVKPVSAGNLPDEVLGLTLRHTLNQSTIIKSVVERDLDIAFNAFLNDPLVNSDLDSATELYKEMLSAVRTHLLYYTV